LSIPKLEILENADFFQVPIATLQEGFGDSIRNAIMNFAAKFINLSSGSGFFFNFLDFISQATLNFMYTHKIRFKILLLN